MSPAEISKRAKDKSLSAKEGKRYIKEEKQRKARNIQKRNQ
ncbi:hypothetical protein [Neobacillus notoginsengisoli]|nr:hypothetical protein [Neobacillus notoginsengisoli]